MTDTKITPWGCNAKYGDEISLCLQLQKHATKAIRFGINSRNPRITNDPMHAEYIATIFNVLNESQFISTLSSESEFYPHIDRKDDKWVSFHGEESKEKRLELVLITLFEELSEFITSIFEPTATHLVVEEWAHCYWAYTKLIGLGAITHDELNDDLFNELMSKYNF